MKDLIERQAAIDAVNNKCNDVRAVIWEVVEALENLPSAQPEIIRCKDCKYWCEWKYVNGKPKFLPRCGFHQTYTREDDFCSKAERRDDG